MLPGALRGYKIRVSMASRKTKDATCFFVTGSDEVGVKKTAVALAESLAPGADAFGIEVVDGAVDSAEAAVGKIEDALSAVLTLPFLGGEKLVWLKSASFLSDTQAGRAESVVSAVERLCEVLASGLPEGVRFLLSAVQPDKRRSGYKTLSKLCETKVVDLPDLGFRGGDEAIVEWTASEARKRGLQFSPEGVDALAARVGLDAAQLANELDKLESAFGKAGRIGAEDVRLLVPQTRAGGIFDLSEAILRRDLPLALDTLAQLQRQGEKGVGILLAAIVPTVRNLLLMRDLMARFRIVPTQYSKQFAGELERLPKEVTSHLPRKKDGALNAYPLSLAAIHASNYSLTELDGGLRACAEAAQQLFTGTVGDDVVLARFLLGFLGRA